MRPLPTLWSDDAPDDPASKLAKPHKESPATQRKKNGRKPPSSAAEADLASSAAPTATPIDGKRVTPTQQRKSRSGAIGANGNGSSANGVAKPPPTPPAPQQTPLAKPQLRPWYGDNPSLEQQIPNLLQRCSAPQSSPEAAQAAMAAALEARTLLSTAAETDAPITQFYLGVAVGVAEGEAAACDYYERALKQLPLLHNARNNLIRGLMRRGTPESQKQALEHANLSAGLQPDVAEMQYQLGVVLMQMSRHAEASAAYERTLKLDPNHRGAFVNGVHCIQLLPPGDKAARKKLEKVARMAVAAGMWATWMQRPPHFVPALRSQPWWDKRAFGWCALLERNYAAIRDEVLALRRTPANFTPVGGRAAHDHTLVVAGEWKEFPLFGNGRCYEENCARCPVTTQTMRHATAAIQLAMAGGGETLFSTLKPGTHLRPHCGSTNTRLTAHLGILVPPGCWIRCGDEWREWREGECLVFDDSWEHEVKQEADQDRVVLLINFWHPELPEDQKKIDIDTYGYQAI